MPYIIDGNNLIGSSPDLSLEEAGSRQQLIHIVRKFQQSRNSKVIIVFDGEPEGTSHRQELGPKYTVLYPRYGRSADDEIKRILNSYNDFRDVVLVTSDRELKSFARGLGARTVNSIEFYFTLKREYRVTGKKEETQKRIETSLSDQEVDQWLKIFSGD
ncbi:MAG: NYN domain-containing protein [Acidobacteriota bacterium]|jgi:predicted RNA-binding protein with PIN domain|nr:NYN domain-containing protein [Acidobacteriota bacterium]